MCIALLSVHRYFVMFNSAWCTCILCLLKFNPQISKNEHETDVVRKLETLPVFWIKVMAEYPEIVTTALTSLSPFPTCYLCEAGISAVTATETKQRNKLDISDTLRVSLSPITPDGTVSL